MIKIDFSEEEIEALKHERFYHPHPRVQRKMEALLLKSQKTPHEQICQIAGISANTLRSYLRAYVDGGIDKLKEINFYRQKSELVAHKKTKVMKHLKFGICQFDRLTVNPNISSARMYNKPMVLNH